MFIVIATVDFTLGKTLQPHYILSNIFENA